MLGTEFVFSSLVSQLFETKNSGFPCASAILWLCSSTSRTVIPKRVRNSFSVLPGCIDCLSGDNTAAKAQVDTPITGRAAACALGEDPFALLLIGSRSRYFTQGRSARGNIAE